MFPPYLLRQLWAEEFNKTNQTDTLVSNTCKNDKHS